MASLPRGRQRSVVTVAVLLLLAVAGAPALKVDIDVEGADSAVIALGPSFGFEAGGRFSLDLTVEPDDFFYLAWYDESQWSDVQVSAFFNSSGLCFMPSARRFEFADGVVGDGTLDYESQYQLAIVNCKYRDLTVTGTAEFFNPYWEHVSLRDRYFLLCYALLTGMSAVALIAWATQYCLSARRLRLGGLHHVVTLVLGSKTLETTASLVYFSIYSSSGVISGPALGARKAMTVVAETSFLVVMLLTGMGWRISRQRLSSRGRQLLAVMVIMFLIFNTFFELCENSPICGAVLLSLYVVRFLIAFTVVVHLNGMILSLRIESAAQRGIQRQITYAKLRLYQSFRAIFLAYLLLPIGLLFVDFALLPWKQEWIVELTQELGALLAISFVAISFRAQVGPLAVNLFYYRRRRNEMAANAGGNDNANNANNDAND